MQDHILLTFGLTHANFHLIRIERKEIKEEFVVCVKKACFWNIKKMRPYRVTENKKKVLTSLKVIVQLIMVESIWYVTWLVGWLILKDS